jgi:hypothetical protein
MKIFWFSLAGLVILMLVFYLTCRNVSVFFHNIFHKRRKRFSWNAIEGWEDLSGPDYWDVTEDFYHR